MKGIIVSGKQTGWEKDLLGVNNRLELPVVNKFLFEYYLDFFHLLGIKEVLILQDEFSEKVISLVEMYKPWFRKVEIKNYDTEKSLEHEVSRYQGFLNKKEVFIVEASSFVLYDKENQNIFDINRKRNCWITSEVNNTNFIQRKIKDIKDLYDLNICLLKEYQSNYSLSGYKLGDAYFGQNNKVCEGTLQNSLTHLGNDVTVEKGVLVEGVNIIGRRSFLSGSCKLEETIVLDNVIVNKDLDLRKKIITKNKIICPYSGVSFETDDEISLSNKVDFSMSNFAIRYFIGLLVLPLAYLFTKLAHFYHQSEEVSYTSSSRKRKSVRLSNYFETIDFVIWLGEFCKGNIRLIGDSPCESDVVKPGVIRPTYVFGQDGFSSGHLNYLFIKNSYAYEVSLLLGSFK